MRTIYRNMVDTVGLVSKMATRIAAIGVLVAAVWDDEDPVTYDPLISR